MFVAKRTAIEVQQREGQTPRLVQREDTTGKQRLVTDMKRSGANEAFLDLRFRYGDFARHLAERVGRDRHEWGAAFDFKAAYHSIALAPGLQRWMAVRGVGGRMF